MYEAPMSTLLGPLHQIDAGATISLIDASHVVMVSHPDVVADVIRTAIAATAPGT